MVSTSISAANGFAIARDLKGEMYDVVAFIGDGSINSGLALEGLNSIAHSNNKVIIVINDNDMSISKPVGGLSKFLEDISTSRRYNKFKHRYQIRLGKCKFGRWLLKVSGKIKNGFKHLLVKGNVFTDLGFAYVGPIDGHNIKSIERSLKRALLHWLDW